MSYQRATVLRKYLSSLLRKSGTSQSIPLRVNITTSCRMPNAPFALRSKVALVEEALTELVGLRSRLLLGSVLSKVGTANLLQRPTLFIWSTIHYITGNLEDALGKLHISKAPDVCAFSCY